MSRHRQEFEEAYLSRGIVRSVEEWALKNNINLEAAVQEHVNVKETLSKNISPSFVENVLDVGCGPGFLLRRLSAKYNPFLLYGVDISRFELENATMNIPSANLICSCAENLPFRDEAFQNIVCSEVLEHVINPRKALKEIMRVLRINGKVGISTPNPNSLIMKFNQLRVQKKKVEHVCKDEPIETRKLISMFPANLEVCKKAFTNPFPIFPNKGIFKSKFLAKLFIKLSSPLQKIPTLNSRVCRHYIIVAKRKR